MTLFSKQKRTLQLLLNITVLSIAVLFLVSVDNDARARRKLPPPQASGAPTITWAATQSEAYALYRSLGLWGAHVVHLNRFLNMVEYYPREEAVSVPFPIRTHDIRPFYEKGLDSHTWLFIANRTGLVRTVTVVLPDSIFRERAELFRSDPTVAFTGTMMQGYAQDLTFMVTKLIDLPIMEEPVIVNVDAGFFAPEIDPVRTAEVLRRKCPDIRIIVLSESRDETEVTQVMREKLKTFEAAFLSPAVPEGGLRTQ